MLEERVHLPAREDGGEVVGPLGTLEAGQRGHVELEDAAVEEDDGAQGLVLRRHGQPGSSDLGRQVAA